MAVADDDAVILPRHLTVKATSAEHGLQLARATRAWYLAHGIDPGDFHATVEVRKRTGRAYGVPLVAVGVGAERRPGGVASLRRVNGGHERRRTLLGQTLDVYGQSPSFLSPSPLSPWSPDLAGLPTPSLPLPGSTSTSSPLQPPRATISNRSSELTHQWPPRPQSRRTPTRHLVYRVLSHGNWNTLCAGLGWWPDVAPLPATRGTWRSFEHTTRWPAPRALVDGCWALRARRSWDRPPSPPAPLRQALRWPALSRSSRGSQTVPTARRWQTTTSMSASPLAGRRHRHGGCRLTTRRSPRVSGTGRSEVGKLRRL